MAMSPDGKVVETDSPKTAQTTQEGAGVAEGVESQRKAETETAESQKAAEGSLASNIVQRWRKEDLLKKWSLGLLVSSFIFSFLAFIIMASNKHGDWNFKKYQEYKYALAIAIISTIYTALQAFFQFNELSYGRNFISRHDMMMLIFFGDQLMAYLLLSAASSAVPLTNRMNDPTEDDYIFSERTEEIFINSSAAAISMEFFAFFAVAISALISGYKLCNHSKI
ncbi:hypothetical protein LIER_05895 [Lithospermum erythrorhizon]|uniref:CASP-like protein n=1 Tax=Lithospermum erythrorhizon TaxID=34254 RepID=A0AAV3P2H0_LITER